MSLAPRIDKFEKNAIINGNFDFWQRVNGSATNVNITNTSFAAFTADRCLNTANAISSLVNYSIQRSTNIPSLLQSGFQSTYSYQLTNNAISNATTTNPANYIVPYLYKLEGNDYVKLHGKKVNWSFWFQSSIAGTYSFAIRGANSTRSYVTTFTVALANTWQLVSIPIQMESAGAYNFDNSLGIDILIASLAGSNSVASTNNIWTSSNTFSSATAINWSATAGAVFNIAQFSAVDTTNTSNSTTSVFSRAGNTIGQELILCQRYYETGFGGWIGYAVAGGFVGDYISYAVTKRVLPTFMQTSVEENANNNAINIGPIRINGFRNYTTAAVTGNSYYTYNWAVDAEL